MQWIKFLVLVFVGCLGLFGVSDHIDKHALLSKPGIKASHLNQCLDHLINEPSCFDSTHSPLNCSMVSTNPRISALIRCMAQSVIDEGFDIPVYVMHNPANIMRFNRLSRHLSQCGFRNESITWITGFTPEEAEKNYSESFIVTRRHDAYSLNYCRKILPAWACEHGYSLAPSGKSIALKHAFVLATIASRSSIPSHFDFSLVLEDDQFLPLDFRRLIVETLLLASPQIEIIMLDDSYFFSPSYAPPSHLKNARFLHVYAKNSTRTMGSYLVDSSAASKIRYGGFLFPFISPIDHQVSYAFTNMNISGGWVFPPLSCSGSQGLEEAEYQRLKIQYKAGSSTGGEHIDPGDRWGCKFCCDRFYNMTTLESYDELL